jgi:hypothetical protein
MVDRPCISQAWLGHVRLVNVSAGAGNIDSGTAEAVGAAGWQLRWQPGPRVVHGVFPRCPCALAAVFLEIGRLAPRQVFRPSRIKVGTRLLETFSRSVGMLAPMRHGIKPAAPAPLIDVMGNAGTLGDGADTHIAVEDMPAFLVGFP